MKLCKVKNCNNKHYGLGFCNRHYWQFRYDGKIKLITCYTPNKIVKYSDYAIMFIRNRKRKVIAKTIIDIDDVDKVSKYKWHLSKGKNNNYVQCIKLHIRLQRFVMNIDNSRKIDVDHINRNSLDNRKCNLRVVSRSHNSFNTDIPKNNTSGTVGVVWNKLRNKYMSRINVNYKNIFLGNFDNITDAINARKRAELKYYGEIINR